MTLDRERLKKLLLVALSSDQPGEVMAALNKVRKVLGLGNVDIHWLAGQLADVQVKPPPAYEKWQPQPMHEADWEDQLDFCSRNEALRFLRDREVEFIISLNEQRYRNHYWSPSPKQAAWLQSIYTRTKLWAGI
jgi:hypothetical protein